MCQLKRKKKYFGKITRTLHHICQHVTQVMSYRYIPTLFSVLQQNREKLLQICYILPEDQDILKLNKNLEKQK